MYKKYTAEARPATTQRNFKSTEKAKVLEANFLTSVSKPTLATIDKAP